MMKAQLLLITIIFTLAILLSGCVTDNKTSAPEPQKSSETSNNSSPIEIKIDTRGPSGLWQRIFPFDIDGDGDTDYLLGNWGTNSKFTASEENPLKMYFADFDANGSTETVLATAKNGTYYPLVGLDELGSQMVMLRKKYPQYRDFAVRRGAAVGQLKTSGRRGDREGDGVVDDVGFLGALAVGGRRRRQLDGRCQCTFSPVTDGDRRFARLSQVVLFLFRQLAALAELAAVVTADLPHDEEIAEQGHVEIEHFVQCVVASRVVEQVDIGVVRVVPAWRASDNDPRRNAARFAGR